MESINASTEIGTHNNIHGFLRESRLSNAHSPHAPAGLNSTGQKYLPCYAEGTNHATS